MADYRVENYYKNLIEKTNELKDEKNDLQGKLKEYGFINDKHKSLKELLNHLVLNENFPSAQIQEVVSKSTKLINAVNKFDEMHKESDYLEIAKQKAVRKAEREDDWKLWRDKLGRWVLGVSAAVLLYSALVALSKWWGFITIPVRDLVIGG